MRRPAYRITIGDHVVDTTAEPKASTAVHLTVHLDMDTPADQFTLVQGQVGGLTAEPGDEASVDLGYADDGGLVRVLTGIVVAAEPGIETTRIVGHSLADRLLRTFVDTTYEDTSAGDVVRDLAAQASVDIERVEDGIRLPAYVVDGRRTAARHVHDLARLSGFDTYLTPQGRLVFEGFAGNRTVHVLKYSEHVLDARLAVARPFAATVQVWGESPGSSRGDESWAWLTKDFTPRRGLAGSGSPTLLLERPALRTAQAAATTARAVADSLVEAGVVGRVRIQGRPQVSLGDLVRLEQFPETAGVDRLDGSYQVRAVDHTIDKSAGLVTEVGFRSLAGHAAGAIGGT